MLSFHLCLSTASDFFPSGIRSDLLENGHAETHACLVNGCIGVDNYVWIMWYKK
jgi:hypothetical protein